MKDANGDADTGTNARRRLHVYHINSHTVPLLTQDPH